MNIRRLAHDYLPAALLLLALLGLWELYVAVFDVPSYQLPPPSMVWAAFVDSAGELPPHIRATTFEAVVGLLVGALGGLAVAIVVHSVALARRVLYPLLVGSQTIPIIVLAPLLLLWFGFDSTPKILVVALIVFFPVAISTISGLAAADPELTDLIRSMGGSRSDVLRHVLVPAATPSFFAGLRIAAAYAVGGAVVAEWIGAQHGLGIYITRSQASFRVDQVFVAVALVALLSLLLFGAVHLAARLASPWLYISTDDEGT